jgi:hypothetical protein
MKTLNWLKESFQDHYPDTLPKVFFYPTTEGGAQAEWSIGPWEISLEVGRDQHHGQWHALNIDNEQEWRLMLDLRDPDSWKWIVTEITKRCHESLGSVE